MENPVMAYRPDMNFNYAEGAAMGEFPNKQQESSSSVSSSASTFTDHQQQHQQLHQRKTPHLPRGVLKPSGAQSKEWLSEVQQKINYEFHVAELLEEALESPGSGITCVGEGERHRHFLDGNRGLAAVGQSVMKMTLRDACYMLQVPEGEATKRVETLISLRTLEKIGKQTKIESFVRPMMPLRKKNLWTLLKDDVQREDPSRTIARALKAIVGAVYYDGGLEAARKVMVDLGLEIKAIAV